MLSFLGRPLQGQPRSDALGALASARMGLLDVPRVMGVKMPCIEFARYSNHSNRFSAAAGQDEDQYLTDDQVQLALKREAHTMSGTTKVFIASQDFLWMMCRADSDEHAFVLADVHLAMWGYTMGELDFAVVPAAEDGQGRIAQSSGTSTHWVGALVDFGGGVALFYDPLRHTEPRLYYDRFTRWVQSRRQSPSIPGLVAACKTANRQVDGSSCGAYFVAWAALHMRGSSNAGMGQLPPPLEMRLQLVADHLKRGQPEGRWRPELSVEQQQVLLVARNAKRDMAAPPQAVAIDCMLGGTGKGPAEPASGKLDSTKLQAEFTAMLDDLEANPLVKAVKRVQGSAAGTTQVRAAASACSPIAGRGVRTSAPPTGKAARYVFYPRGIKHGTSVHRVAFDIASGGPSVSSLLAHVRSIAMRYPSAPSGDVRLEYWDTEFHWTECTELPGAGSELRLVSASAPAGAKEEERRVARRLGNQLNAFQMMSRGAMQQALEEKLTPPDTELANGGRYGWAVWGGDASNGGEHLQYFRDEPVAAVLAACAYARLDPTAIRLVAISKGKLNRGESVQFDFSPTALQYFVSLKVAVDMDHKPAARKLVSPQQFYGLLAKARVAGRKSKPKSGCRKHQSHSEILGELQAAREHAATAAKGSDAWAKSQAAAAVMRLEQAATSAAAVERNIRGKKQRVADEMQKDANKHSRYDANSGAASALALATSRTQAFFSPPPNPPTPPVSSPSASTVHPPAPMTLATAKAAMEQQLLKGGMSNQGSLQQ